MKNKENDLSVVHDGSMNVLMLVNIGEKSMGLRFDILGKDIPNLEVENLEDEKIMGENIFQKIMQNRLRKNVSREKRKIINRLIMETICDHNM